MRIESEKLFSKTGRKTLPTAHRLNQSPTPLPPPPRGEPRFLGPSAPATEVRQATRPLTARSACPRAFPQIRRWAPSEQRCQLSAFSHSPAVSGSSVATVTVYRFLAQVCAASPMT